MRYRMKTVTELTGIPRNTLVAWERRYGIPSPERLSNGYRLYSDEDVRLLLRLRDALAGGLAISEAVELVGEGGAPPSPAAEAPLPVVSSFAKVQDDLLGALLDFDRPRADRLVERLLHVPYLTAIDQVYFPLLRRVGELWERGEVSVAQEHFASAFARDQLVAMLLHVGVGRPSGPRVVCATFPEEKHELGLLALAVHLSLRGCRVTYLGADVPTKDLAGLLAERPHDWVCVSVILATEADALLAYARAVARSAGEGTRVVIGGAGLPATLPRRMPGNVQLLRDWREIEIP